MSGFSFNNGSSQPFGSSSNPPQNATGGLFGASSTPVTSSQPTASLFGGSSALGNTFSSTSNTTSTPQASIFASTSKPSSAPLYGGSTGTAPLTFGRGPAATTPGLFSNLGASNPSFSFTPKKDDNPASTDSDAENKPAGNQGGGLFTNLNKPSPGLFGTPSTNATATASGITTPAPAKGGFSFGSTTPAGPPPANNNSSQPVSSVFGQTTSAGTGTASGLFGAKTPATSNIFGTSSLSAPTSSAANTAPASVPVSTTSNPSFSFPVTNSQVSQAASSTPASIPTASLFTKSSSVQPPGSGLFTGLGGSSNPSTSQNATASASPGTSNLFSAPGPTPTPSATSITAAPSSTAAPTAAASLSGLATSSSTISTQLSSAPVLGAGLLQQTQPTSTAHTQASSTPTTVPPVESTTAAPNNSSKTGPQTLGASTAGPAPQISRLKNKTMDEIITRWASDLLKYQKEFQDQATKVAAWDRLLVENGEKIQKLYSSTYEAERATTEVERQLATVEGQQAELETWLDRYEADVDEMFTRQVGQGETLQGPDQERERTYKLAEKLTDRLDEMGKNITNMIEAINEASSSLSKNTKTDDPLSHIVRVLNSHLSQLQWIDQNAEILQQKVIAAQKFGQSINQNGHGSQDSDAADAFYRSYIGRR